METKDQLVSHIREWITVDNEIKVLQKQLKERREQKKTLTGSLVDVMKSNEIDCFDINDGKLVYAKTKTRTPLSKKHLLNSLLMYYKDDADKAQSISKFIMDSRDVKTNESIRRKLQK